MPTEKKDSNLHHEENRWRSENLTQNAARVNQLAEDAALGRVGGRVGNVGNIRYDVILYNRRNVAEKRGNMVKFERNASHSIR